MNDDATLLRLYAAENSGPAFAELVRRYLPLVYSSALRRLDGDVHRAEDISQVVFCALARNAQRLASHPALAGWLYTATRNEVCNVLRGERRRRIREQEAHTMHEISMETETPADWSQLRPVLDTAMDQLNERDREAVLLRFFQGLPFAEIGAMIGTTEEAARKRVERAVDKLRTTLQPHGVASTSAALATLLTSQTMSAAPATLEGTITGAALATGASTGARVGTFLTLTKLQAGFAAVLVAAGGTGLVLQQRTLSALRADHQKTEQHVASLARENATLAQVRAGAQAELARLRVDASRLNISVYEERPVAARHAAGAGSTAVPVVAAPSRASSATDDTKAKLHRRYDPFLQKHGLTPAQADRFVDLKIAIADAQADLQAAMRQAGAQGGTHEVEAMRSKLVRPMWDEIRDLLGTEGYAEYRDYEKTSAFRLGYVEPLLATFAAANVPLSTEQADALTQVFASNSRSVRANPTDLGTTGIMDWPGVVAQSSSILKPAQHALLQSHANRRNTAQHSP